MQDADIGIDRAFSTIPISSSSLSWTSTWTSPRVAGSGAEPAAQPGQDGVGHEPPDVPAPPGDLLDETRGEERVVRVGRHEERLDAAEPVVHLGHLQLVV